MTTLIEKFDENSATATAAAWPKLREILSRASTPKATDHTKLSESMQALNITRSDLPHLVETLAEFTGLANVDECLAQALTSAENARAELVKAESEGEVKVKAFREWRDQFQIHIFRIKAFVEAAAKGITSAQQRRERRIEIARQHRELVGTDEAQAVIAAEQARQDEQARIQRDELAVEARKSALNGGFGDVVRFLPDDELSTLADLVARGQLTRGHIDPGDEHPDRLIEPGLMSDMFSELVNERRQALAAQLARGEITRTEAGKSVVELAVHRRLIPAKDADDSAREFRQEARVTGGWKR